MAIKMNSSIITLFILCFNVFFCRCNDILNTNFAGFYHLDQNHGDDPYAGAWLVSVTRFLYHEPVFKLLSVLEHASQFLVKDRRRNHLEDQIGTRDYFDYFVEHMSSTSNTLDIKHFDHLFEKLTSTMKHLQVKSVQQNHLRLTDLREKQTLAFMVYYSRPAIEHLKDDKQSKIREYFLNITFWSVHRYFPNVAIFVGRDQDYVSVQNLHLPYYLLENVCSHLNATEIESQNPNLIPKLTLFRVYDHFQSADLRSKFKYLYYTESDQILHMRRIPDIFNAIGD